MSQDNYIGNVRLTYLEKESRIYKDNAEEALLDLFSNEDAAQRRKKLLEKPLEWAMYYHLSYQRGNVVSWIDFEPGSHVLEVGAGCGSITEELATKDIRVVANDISEERCLVNAHRNKRSKNLEIVVGNLEKFKPDEKFDYVVCIGVLEYAGTFITGDEPYEKFLSYLKSFLKPSGKIIIAIENKLGFKYLAGSYEDHTGIVFDSINNYMTSEIKVRTFGKLELDTLLSRNFSSRAFYYPFPDYKLPRLIYSDSYHPGKNIGFPYRVLPTPNPDRHRFHLFNEKPFVYSLINNGLYRDFSNSFIVIASNAELPELPEYSLLTNSSEERRLETRIQTSSKKRIVRKSNRRKRTKPTITLLENYKLLENYFSKTSVRLPKILDTKSGIIDFEFIQGKDASTLLSEALIRRDIKNINHVLDSFLGIVEQLAAKSEKDNNLEEEYFDVFGTAFKDSFGKSLPGVIDLNLDNFIIAEDGSWYFIDFEWIFDFRIPQLHAAGRVLFYEFFVRHADIVEALSSNMESRELLDVAIPLVLYKRYETFLKVSNLRKVISSEERFQQFAEGNTQRINKKYFKKSNYNDLLSLYNENIDLYHKNQTNINKLGELEHEVSRLSSSNEHMRNRLESIEKLKLYRIARKMKRLGRKLK